MIIVSITAKIYASGRNFCITIVDACAKPSIMPLFFLVLLILFSVIYIFLLFFIYLSLLKFYKKPSNYFIVIARVKPEAIYYFGLLRLTLCALRQRFAMTIEFYKVSTSTSLGLLIIKSASVFAFISSTLEVENISVSSNPLSVTLITPFSVTIILT